MAIKFITEMPGSSSRSDGEITIIRNLKYQVTAGSDPRDIIFDSNIPADGTVHPAKSGYYVIGISEPRRDSGGSYDGAYLVAINYGLASRLTTEMQKRDSTKTPWDQGALEVSYDSIDVVVPQVKYYKEGDTRYNPTGAMVHPATGEALISDTKETHILTNIRFALKTFKYDWIRYYRGTTNRNSVNILGTTYPEMTALITKISATKKKFSTGLRETSYWELVFQIEDFGHPVTKTIALQGYHCKISGKIVNIQLKNGVFGNYNDPALNIPTPRFVSKTGVVLPADGTVNDDYYLDVPDIFTTEWANLSFPKTEA